MDEIKTMTNYLLKNLLLSTVIVFTVGMNGAWAQERYVKQTPATFTSNTNIKPSYPPMSKRLSEQGTVVLRVLVKSDGTAGTIEIKSSSGFPRLDQAAIDAVKTWRFNPATNDGKPVDEWYPAPFTFKLQSSSN